MRLIDADALTKLHCEGCAEDVRAICKDDPVCASLMWVAEAPTIEAEPVRHGRWSLAEDGDGVVCSCCGKDFCNLVYETDDFKYCPNCGARMYGDSHD